VSPRPQSPAPLGETSVALLARALGARLVGDGSARVRGLHHDSRRIEPGDLFVARRGERADGLAFVRDAIDRGARAVLAEQGHAPEATEVPVLLVDDVRAAIGKAASVLYGDPTAALGVVGITGTNGKTTTSYLARAAIDGAGGRAGVLGTLGVSFGELSLGAVHTTPEADELVRVAARMRELGASHLVMEVSSHALALGRVEAVRFAVAAFTNLTQDHLDFHGTMQAYAAAKARLFEQLGPRAAAIAVDDAFGAELAARVRCPLVRVSADPRARADVRPAAPPQLDARGIRCRVGTPGGEVSLHSGLVGEHNLANLLLALGIAAALGLPIEGAARALSGGIAVPGRLERCDGAGDDVLVLVDYAHTPDALERALRAIRSIASGRVLCVFGCGGDRDRAKRAMMGEVVSRLADVAIVTNDNPRSEPPEQIAAAIVSGMGGGSARTHVELDRGRAIGQAVEQARAGDAVLIAGKGHEPYQIVGAETRHFDDREQARGALATRRARATRAEGNGA
jgi:UDP-N-acetylmuramoyl-L-alanyl-D-glutamate--2,6-diaminopimelate ligase